MDQYLRDTVLNQPTLGEGLARHISSKLQSHENDMNAVDYHCILTDAMEADPDIVCACAADLSRFKVVDPACDGLLGVYLFYKGVQAMACARVSHYYWAEPGGHGKLIARLLQSEMSEIYGMDIHPGATLGRGITIDHGTGVTIGETGTIGDNVYIMHDVTLGATGTSEDNDRHPKIGNNVFLGAKCTVLGNIEIGEGATVAASALVNKPLPAGYTAVGVPAKFIAPKNTFTLSKAK